MEFKKRSNQLRTIGAAPIVVIKAPEKNNSMSAWHLNYSRKNSLRLQLVLKLLQCCFLHLDLYIYSGHIYSGHIYVPRILLICALFELRSAI